MQWMVKEVLGPVAGRVGGQVAAALVALGMAHQHENAVGAVVAWAIVSAAEVALSARNRKRLIEQAKNSWGRN